MPAFKSKTRSSLWLAFFLFALCLVISLPATASLKDIDKAKLPASKEISKAYEDAASVESMAKDWHNVWPFPTPKERVMASLSVSMAELQKATHTAEDNEELWLLTGIVAHYAYNLDVDGSYELATKSFAAARKLAPDDYRSDWFEAALVCQTPQTKKGMDSFLAIESKRPWEKLPVGFWSDYISCATVTVMPVHTIRAGAYLEKLDPERSNYPDSLLQIAKKRIKDPDVSKTYSEKEVWSAEVSDTRAQFTNAMAGLRFEVPGDWKLRFYEIQHGQSLVQINIPAFHTSSGDVSPSILVIARPPKSGETLDDFMKALMKYPSSQPTSIAHCPSESCSSIRGNEPGTYGDKGDGNAIITGFQRKEPKYPGIKFEESLNLPEPQAGQPQYFKPSEKIGRIPGTLYYLVLLDTASSAQQQAEKAFEEFLKNLQVE